MHASCIGVDPVRYATEACKGNPHDNRGLIGMRISGIFTHVLTVVKMREKNETQFFILPYMNILRFENIKEFG